MQIGAAGSVKIRPEKENSAKDEPKYLTGAIYAGGTGHARLFGLLWLAVMLAAGRNGWKAFGAATTRSDARELAAANLNTPVR